MKNAFIVIGVSLLFLSMPVGLCSDCGCDEKAVTDVGTEQSSAPWLTADDIAALQEQGKQEGWTFTVAENPATQRPFNQLCGFVVPDNWWVNADFDPCTPTRDLPTRFDWRELGGCTPIKNQESCGSCWAFGTMAALECNILIRDHQEVDLSEQWLVSCNRNNWGCQGGWWAHDYFQWKLDKSNATGAVLEDEFPYVAQNVPCEGGYSHPYKIDSWRFVGTPGGVPSVNGMKQAIMTYGPISVAIAVTGAFGGYTGGVFNQDDPGAGINHAVALVGWDDSQGENGVWFLRNSWGPWWGEDGYMRIEYGVLKVGYAACYVDYPLRTKIDIKSGVLGLNVDLTNADNVTKENIAWNIVMKGGVYGNVNLSLNTNIPALQPSETVNRRIMRFGFGPVTITATADPSGPTKTTSTANGYLLGLILVILDEN